MYKHVALLVRQDGLSHEEFVDYWQSQHTPIAREIDGVVRYQQVLPTDPEHAEFDGLAELSFEDLEALHDALGSPGSRDYDPERGKAREAREDVDNFLAIDERPRFIGEEIVQKDEVGGDTDGLYKHSAFLVRQDGISHEEFVDYWQSQHTPIAREIEGVVRYATVLPTDPVNAEFDGIAELYFEDLEKLYEALGSEGSRDYDPERGKAREAREDVDNFLAIDERPRFIGRERLVDVEGGSSTSGPIADAEDTPREGSER
ncbi:EthD family reductase [Natrarchaeobius sp. A-rgal3]|uniref:EthD family reductase n=1 Tax=Natrarchaeobius versutus TaxID=1679078 RepID=UPI003510BDF6